MQFLTEILVEALKQYGIQEVFKLFGAEISTVVLLYVYLMAMAVFLIYSSISIFIGNIFDIFDIGDGGTFPAVSIGLGIFSAFGALSLFFMKATPAGSIGYGLVGGLLSFGLFVYGLNWFKNNQSNSILDANDLTGLTGTCYLNIKDGRPGQIKVSVNGRWEYPKAWSKQNISDGDLIRIINIRSAYEVDVEKADS